MKDANYLVDMKNSIYADNAATTDIDLKSLEAMSNYLEMDFSNPSQPYFLSSNSKKILKKSREIIAKCINASPEEIYFTSGGTESDNWAITGTLFKYNNSVNMITDVIEHHAILNTCKFMQRLGYHVSYLPVDFKGHVSIDDLKKGINSNTKLISIMLANNEIGTIQDIKSLCEISHKNNIVFHTDAVQAIGHIKIDVKDLDVDLLSASAHKFNGPKGIGFLYIKKGIEIEPLIHGGSQESNMRAGTENVAAILGMAIALKNNCDNLVNNIEKITNIERKFYEELTKTNLDYRINGDRFSKLPGNINISFKDSNGEMILHRLDLKGISISTGSACDSINNQVSHVIKSIKVPNEYAEGTIRITFGKNNTINDSVAIVNELKNILI